MSFLPGEKLHYAETHFKFKLPWSFLYRPWPEIIFDMPFQIVPNETPTIWIVIRDANRFPVILESVTIKISSKEKEQDLSIPLNFESNKSIEFYPIPLPNLNPGNYKIYPELTLYKKNKISQKKIIKRWNLIGLRSKPLYVQILKENPPKPEGFVAGDMHTHSYYSCSHVEFGASPSVIKQAAKSVGLDFVNITDHAYDFQFSKEDYTKEIEFPITRFKELKQELEILNSNEKPLLLASEEISVGNHKDENVHMLALAPSDYLPGLGDCGRFWLENKPTKKISTILNDTKALCFAAHPLQPMGILERFIFRRGYWSYKDLNIQNKHCIRGIQFWNGIRDEGFKLGREFWINALGKGHFLLPIGGNDAHGDLNDSTAVQMPLVSLKNSKEHVFGNVRTVIQLKNKESISIESLNEAFNNDNCYITDGPALWWERLDDKIIFHAFNTLDYGGAFKYIKIFGRFQLPNGKFSSNEFLCKESLVLAPAKTDISIYIDNYAYLRAECETAIGKFALTSAVNLTK